MKWRYLNAYFWGILICLNLSSCYYFKVAKSVPGGHEIDGAISRGKNLIIHSGSESFQLFYPSISIDKTTLSGQMAPVTYNHQFYKLVKRRGSNRYKKDMGDPSKDVNIYITEYTLDSLEEVKIPLSAVIRMDIYAKQNTKSSLTFVGSIIGGYYATLFLIFALAG